MKEKVLCFIICILTITLIVGCKTTQNQQEKEMNTATPSVEANITEDNAEQDSVDSAKPAYTIETLSKEMLAKQTSNIRSEPSTESPVLGKLLVNEKITVTGKVKENGWYQVSYNGAEAYTHYDNLTDIVENATPSTTTSPSTQKSVKDLDIATQTDQLILVAVSGTNATFSMYTKNADGSWKTVVSTDTCYIGRDGLGKTKEGNMETPTGTFRFTKAFGINSNPGTHLDYTKVDSSHYWVDDPNSRYYNQFVSTNNVTKDWDSAEHIVEYTSQYKYCLVLDYNKECIPGNGSAIFLHCTNYRATGGCIAIP